MLRCAALCWRVKRVGAGPLRPRPRTGCDFPSIQPEAGAVGGLEADGAQEVSAILDVQATLPPPASSPLATAGHGSARAQARSSAAVPRMLETPFRIDSVAVFELRRHAEKRRAENEAKKASTTAISISEKPRRFTGWRPRPPRDR